MSGIASAIKVATGEIGYREKPGNFTKYNTWLGSIGGTTGYAWCASFQSWVAAKSGNGAYAPKTAGCLVAVAWFKQRKRWYTSPAVGDWVMYGPGGGTHTELVVGVTSSTITTIGGNTSGSLNGRYFNGDGVYRKVVARSSSRIYGYGRPAYPVAGSTQGDDDVPIRSSYGKTSASAQNLPWNAHTVLNWNKEYADPRKAHAGAGKNRPQGYPGYVSPLSTWADMNVSIKVDGLKPGDYWQLQYQVHNWKNGKSSKKWTECAADMVATSGSQYVTGKIAKGLGKGQHVYVAVVVFPAGGTTKGRAAPKAVAGRWTIAQDKA